MKNFRFWALFATLMLAWSTLHAQKSTDIVVLSDTHLMAPQLNTQPGKAIANYASHDMRMTVQSDEIMQSLIAKIKKMKPKLVLITGDLTKDGERLSHERMVHYLDLLRASGIATLVIPGNHDISNPNAKSFNGDKIKDANTITRKEFARLYHHYGYGNSSQRDTASLSYACEPLAGLVVLAIDSNRDEENTLKSRGDESDTYHNAGQVKPQTAQWLARQAKQARAQGKQVVAIMHHHLIEHFDRESNFLPNYVVANAKELRNMLIEAGVHTVFTGHLHVSDVARDYHNGDSITEVATGSAISYPFHYRTISLKGKELNIKTAQLTAIPSCRNLPAQGKAQVKAQVPAQVDRLARKAWSKVQSRMGKITSMLAMTGGGKKILPDNPDAILNIMHQQYDATAQEAYLAVLEGNEGMNKKSAQLIEKMKQSIGVAFEHVLPSGAGELVQSFMEENAMPELDNLLRSLLNDRNHCGTEQEVVVDDLNITLPL